MTDLMHALAPIGAAINLVWMVSAWAHWQGLRTEVGRWLLWLLKWPALGGIWLAWLDDVLSAHDPGDAGVAAVLLLIGLGSWWLFRNEGDDDWRKRKREQAASKVRAAGHRLVVVPAGAR